MAFRCIHGGVCVGEEGEQQGRRGLSRMHSRPFGIFGLSFRTRGLLPEMCYFVGVEGFAPTPTAPS
eukprot:1668764-Pyramimonas_sp.AAC.1